MSIEVERGKKKKEKKEKKEKKGKIIRVFSECGATATTAYNLLQLPGRPT
jgi:hypothetical protein